MSMVLALRISVVMPTETSFKRQTILEQQTLFLTENKDLLLSRILTVRSSHRFNDFQRRVALNVAGLSLVYKYDRFSQLLEVVRMDPSGGAAILFKLE